MQWQYLRDEHFKFQGSVETLFRWGGKRVHRFAENLFRKLYTKFYLNRPSFIGDITKKTFWSFSHPDTLYNRLWLGFFRMSEDRLLSKINSIASVTVISFNSTSTKRFSYSLWNEMRKLPFQVYDAARTSVVCTTAGRALTHTQTDKMAVTCLLSRQTQTNIRNVSSWHKASYTRISWHTSLAYYFVSQCYNCLFYGESRLLDAFW